MEMRNIRIVAESSTRILVIADSERFGRDEIMAECNTFKSAYDYIKRETGSEKLWLTGTIASAVEDWTGVSAPSFMYVNA
jgi:hypothetical protein